MNEQLKMKLPSNHQSNICQINLSDFLNFPDDNYFGIWDDEDSLKMKFELYHYI